MEVSTSDADKGMQKAVQFLTQCDQDGSSGVVILNAVANILSGFFAAAPFSSRPAMLAEFDNWSSEFRRHLENLPAAH